MDSSYIIAIDSIIPMRKEPSDASEMVSQLLFGELAIVTDTDKQWLNITCQHDNYSGWIDNKMVYKISASFYTHFSENFLLQMEPVRQLKTPWGPMFTVMNSRFPSLEGAFEFEKINFQWTGTPLPFQSKEISEIARMYLNAPYLWGGRSLFGIDCSGFTQLIYHFKNILLPRDASLQVNIGKNLNFNNSTVGDLAFFHNSSGKVTHVGIIIEDKKIIHASGRVRIDFLTEEGIFNREKNKLTHELHSIKRILD